MCFFSTPSMPSAPALPPMPGPSPTSLDPAVVKAGDDMKRKAQAASGYSSTITNSGGGSGLLTPAFTAGSAGFKALTGQ
ncbi:MAG: hypothetical protein KIS73_27050 [Enhydrobacter sp.]|nr:hypothetical protein [Enhydrobacter sp.]